MNMGLLAIPVPPRMARLERDPRGYPIPVTVYRDRGGRPHFTINNEAARQRTIAEDRCPICGGPLLRGRWLVGGPASALHPRGAYIDPPMHDECAHYALRVCPYLAAPSYGKRIDDKTLTDDGKKDAGLMLDPTMMPHRPAVFVAVMFVGRPICISDTVSNGTQRIKMVRHIKPRRPYRRVEFWREGRELHDPAEIARVTNEAMQQIEQSEASA